MPSSIDEARDVTQKTRAYLTIIRLSDTQMLRNFSCLNCNNCGFNKSIIMQLTVMRYVIYYSFKPFQYLMMVLNVLLKCLLNGHLFVRRTCVAVVYSVNGQEMLRQGTYLKKIRLNKWTKVNVTDF